MLSVQRFLKLSPRIVGRGWFHLFGGQRNRNSYFHTECVKRLGKIFHTVSISSSKVKCWDRLSFHSKSFCLTWNILFSNLFFMVTEQSGTWSWLWVPKKWVFSPQVRLKTIVFQWHYLLCGSSPEVLQQHSCQGMEAEKVMPSQVKTWLSEKLVDFFSFQYPFLDYSISSTVLGAVNTNWSAVGQVHARVW